MVVAIVGELDIAASPDVRGLLDEDTVAGPLVIDLTDAGSSTRPGSRPSCTGEAGANGESHGALVSTGGEVRKLLELTAIDRTIPVFETWTRRSRPSGLARSERTRFPP